MKHQFKISLHRKQMEIFTHPARFKLLVCGRRFGKSKVLRALIITAALHFQGNYDPLFPPQVVLLMPTRTQCVQVHWDSLVNELKNQPFVEKINISDRRIILKGNRPNIILRGCDDSGDGLRGLKIYFLGADEFQDVPESVWNNVLRPALADSKGSKALFAGTPKGKSHKFHRFYQTILGLDNWKYFNFETADNPFFPRRELTEAKATMPERIFKQEFQASWEDFPGKIFDQLDESNVVKQAAPGLDYFVGVDFGDINPAVVVIGTDFTNKEIYIVDSWMNKTSAPVVQDQLFKVIADFCKKYNVYRVFMPDDRKATILDAQKYGIKHSIDGMKRTVTVIRGKVPVAVANDIINSYLYQNKLLILSHLTDVRDQFESYHRETVDGQVTNKVAEGQKDHLVDATRYAMTEIHETIRNTKK